MPHHSSNGQWLRFLSATPPTSVRWQHPAAQKALRQLVTLGKVHMLAGVGTMSSKPLTVTDDGVVRVVTAMRSIRYGYNRRDKSFFAVLREEDGGWRFVPESDPNVVIFDTFLPHRVWRRRLRFTLQAELRDLLQGLVVGAVADLPEDHRQRLSAMVEEVIRRAWRGLGQRKRLIARFRTKTVRRQVRDLLQIDPEVLALARTARFRGCQHAIEQKWLSFVWQHRGTLTRIRRQTPTLLRAVAQHMFQYPRNPGEDPTRACLKTLTTNGMSKRSCRLLVRQGDRPFRTVIRRFTTGYALDALLLALRLTESGHDAVAARPLFYRVTFDEFGRSMRPAAIRNRLAVLPGRVFTEARARLALATDELEAQEIALAYRGIVNWFVTCEPEGQEQASWDRWLLLTREAEDRRRATLEPATWPCALEELRTPEAEVLALATPLALFEEGRALRHCAYSYVAKCRDDQARLFSARMWHQGRVERATIGLWREPRGWRIWDIRGPCNRRMGGHWIPLARQVAEAYTRNAASGQLPLPMQCKLDG